MNYGMIDTLEMSGEAGTGGYWSFAAGIIGNDMADTTFTGAIGERVVEDINMFLTKAAIGAAGAVPSSYMTGRFISFKFNLNNGLSRKYFADGTAPTLGGIGRNKREITLEVTMEGNAATITERDAYEAGTSRVVRITATGTTIAGSSPTHARTADLIVCGKWRSFEVGDRDTNTVFTGILEAEYDSVLTYDMSLTVDNLVTSSPRDAAARRHDHARSAQGPVRSVLAGHLRRPGDGCVRGHPLGRPHAHLHRPRHGDEGLERDQSQRPARRSRHRGRMASPATVVHARGDTGDSRGVGTPKSVLERISDAIAYGAGDVDRRYNVMSFCREFHMTVTEYRRQPARDMLHWQQMLGAEAEGHELRRRLEEARAKAKGKR